MKTRVNPDRARRYRQRTMTRPPETYVLTMQELEEHERWAYAWQRGHDDLGPTPPAMEWQARVTAYCKAQGLGLPQFTVEENPLEWGKMIQWNVREAHMPQNRPQEGRGAPSSTSRVSANVEREERA